MRFVMTALVMVALLAVWLITQDPEDERRNEVPTGRDLTPVTIPAEARVPVADQEISQTTIPDQVISDNESVTGPIELEAFLDPTAQASALEFDPEQRDTIVAFLTKRGLATVDSERIADSALNATTECIRQAFGSGATSTLMETCMLNVFAAYGLYEIAGTEIATTD